MSPFRRTRAVRPLSCREVGRLLQRYLDGEIATVTTERVAEHLEDCRRCGLEAEVYREIKDSLARRSSALPETTLRRLRHFGERLATAGGPAGGIAGGPAGGITGGSAGGIAGGPTGGITGGSAGGIAGGDDPGGATEGDGRGGG